MCSAPMEQGQAPIFIVLNAAPEEIAFKLPEDARIQELAAGAEHHRRAGQTTADFASGTETKAPPRSVLAFAGAA